MRVNLKLKIIEFRLNGFSCPEKRALTLNDYRNKNLKGINVVNRAQPSL